MSEQIYRVFFHTKGAQYSRVFWNLAEAQYFAASVNGRLQIG